MTDSNDPAVTNTAAVEPAAVEPAAVEPAAVEPAAVKTAATESPRRKKASSAGDSSLPPATAAGSSGGFLAFIAMIISLFAIGLASWPAYELYRQQNEAVVPEAVTNNEVLAQQIAALETRAEAQSETIALLEDSLSGLASEDDAVDDQAGYRQSVADEIQKLRIQIGTSSQDWLMAEVEYLVRMANQRVLMERDAGSALELLQSADRIISEAKGLTAHALRQALAQDMAALKAVNQVDVQGIYLELSAQMSQVSLLRHSVPVFEADFSPKQASDQVEGLWPQTLAFISSAGNRVSSLVDFRRTTIPVKPILPPAEEYYLRQNLMLKLQIAQLALLKGNTAAFQSSLTEATDWVSGSFDPGDPVTVAMVASLTDLAAKDIESHMPDISDSLTQVRGLLKNFHQAENR